MAYLTPFIQIRINGHFGTASGAEQWSTGFKLHLVGSTTNPEPLLPLIAVPLVNFHTSGAVKAGSTTFMTELTGAVIGTDGKYVGGAAQATKRYTFPTPVQGEGVAIHPWATAMVLSLRSTALGRGPGSHGRMYWPALALNVSAVTGRIAQADRDLMRTAAVTMLSAVNTAVTGELGAGNVIINTSPVREGYRAVVDEVRIGDRPDHIEARENAVPELYSVGAV